MDDYSELLALECSGSVTGKWNISVINIMEIGKLQSSEMEHNGCRGWRSETYDSLFVLRSNNNLHSSLLIVFGDLYELTNFFCLNIRRPPKYITFKLDAMFPVLTFWKV